MKLNFRSVVAGASALAITGGVLAATVGTAAAATPPPWEPDGNSLGSINFYNSAGALITGGNNLNHLADYIEASTADAAGGTKAQLVFANPAPSTPTGGFFTGIGGTSKGFPNAGAPSPLNTDAKPVTALAADEGNLTNFIASSTANTVPGYANVYQVRLITSKPGGGGSSATSTYWEDDIVVSGSSWSIQYPGVVAATTTTLTATPSVGVQTNTNVVLNATETPATPGSVQFKDGATNIGTPVAVNAGGVAHSTGQTFSAATHHFSAVFTPTDTTSFSPSTGTLDLTVTPPVTATSTALTVTHTAFAGDPVGLSAAVTESSAPFNTGTVNFYDGPISGTPLNPSPVTGSGGTFTFSIPAGLAAGAHSITAVFTPTNPGVDGASQSAAQAFNLQTKAASGSPCADPLSVCSEDQTIIANVPVGTLVISTPYTEGNPLDLGSLTLSGDSTHYTTSADFRCIIVTDTTSGGAPWVAKAVASPLTDQNPPAAPPVGSYSTINPANLGLTGLGRPAAGSDPGQAAPYKPACADTQSYTGTVNPTDVPTTSPVALAPGVVAPDGNGLATAQQFATGLGGNGTTTLAGTLTLNAPTSTQSGLYTGTITFTVSDS